MIDLGLAKTIVAICDVYRGRLPSWLVSDLHDIADSDLPAGLRRSAVWLLRREVS